MEVLADCASNVRVLGVRSAADPAVRRILTGRDLAIGLDEASVGIAAQLCPDAPPTASLVNLADAVTWRDACGSRLAPLAPFLPSRESS